MPTWSPVTTAQIRPENGSIALKYGQKCNHINLQYADPRDVCCWYKPANSRLYPRVTIQSACPFVTQKAFYCQGPTPSREDVPSKQFLHNTIIQRDKNSLSQYHQRFQFSQMSAFAVFFFVFCANLEDFDLGTKQHECQLGTTCAHQMSCNMWWAFISLTFHRANNW